MTEPTKRKGVMNMSASDLIRTIEDNALEELLAASSQSAEPQQHEVADLKHYAAIDEIRGYVDTDGLFIYAPLAGQPCPHCGRPLVNVSRYQSDADWFPYCPNCERRSDYLYPLPDSAEPQEAEEVLRRYIKGNSPIDWDRIKPLIDAYALARLASKPSRSEEHELDAFRHAMVMAFQEIRRARRDEGMSEWADDDMANWVLANMPAARPSREEEMRALLVEIDNWITEYNMHWRSYSVSERLKLLNRLAEIQDKARAALAQGGARDEGEGEVKQMLDGLSQGNA